MPIKKKNRKIFLDLFFAFIIPAIILTVALYLNGIYPGSEKTILIYDMAAQYMPFFSYLKKLGSGYNSIMFQHLSGLGGGYFGTWAYYTASPLSFIVLLFDLAALPDVLYILTIIKVSLCGVSFLIYLRYGHIKCNNSVILIIVSATYALISYNIFYSMCLMWLDGVIMLPLVILGADRFFLYKRELLLVLALSISIMINYYTAYMIIVFLVLYFLYYVLLNGYNIKRVIHYGMYFIVSGMVSLFFSSWVLIPVYLDLERGKLSGEIMIFNGMIRNPLNVLRQFIPFSKLSLNPNGSPPFYCGILLFILLLYYFVKICKLKEKIAISIIILFYFISFCWDRVDSFWHGLRIPTQFPARFCFTFSFFLLMISAKCLLNIVSDNKLFSKLFLPVVLIVIHIMDIGTNAFRVINYLDNSPEAGGYLLRRYYEFCLLENTDYINLIGEFYNKTITDYDYSCNDGLLFGVPTLDYFSSSYNNQLSVFYREIGLEGSKLKVGDRGICPLSASLLGVDYLACYMNVNDKYQSTLAFDETDYVSEIGIYKNQYSLQLGYCLNNEQDDIHLYNAFKNINTFNEDASGISDVFVECKTVVEESISKDENANRRLNYKVYPEEGMHLYFYVSPEDYLIGSGRCYDLLCFNGNQIAKYDNNYNRYFVDLGICDGTELDFTFECGSENSKIWFYSFDDDAYRKSMNEISKGAIKNIRYCSNGIFGDVYSVKDTNLLILLPYEKGYSIYIDDVKTDYSSYRGALITVPVTEGYHNIRIEYFTPGLKIGLMISACSLLMGFLMNIFFYMKRNTANNNE